MRSPHYRSPYSIAFSRVVFPQFYGYAADTISIQTGQGFRPLITSSCFSSVVSISHNMEGDIEATNQHREMTSEIVSSRKIVRQELNEEAHVHVSSADTYVRSADSAPRGA